MWLEVNIHSRNDTHIIVCVRARAHAHAHAPERARAHDKLHTMTYLPKATKKWYHFDGVLEKKFQPPRTKPYNFRLVFGSIYACEYYEMETFKLSLFIEKSGTINFNLVHFWRNHDSKRTEFFYFSLRFLCTFRIAYKFLCDMLYATFSKCNSNYDDFGFYPWGVRKKEKKIKTCQRDTERANGREKAGIYSIIPFNIFVVRSYMSFCMVYHSGFYLCVSGGDEQSEMIHITRMTRRGMRPSPSHIHQQTYMYVCV